MMIEGSFLGEGLKIGIVASRFNSTLVDRLIEGAYDALKRHGVKENDITLVRVPGSWELPLACKKLAKKDFDGILAVGVLIRGQTPHFDYIAAEVSKGLAMISLELEKPIAFGVITADSIEQAIERSGTKQGNKGFEAAMALIETINVLKNI
ncbi:6,7-dimethyl-8-ribityllumazine synthase [Hydrogenobaculum acidophilum]